MFEAPTDTPSSSDDLFDDLNTLGVDVNEGEQETETPEDSSPELKETEADPSQDGEDESKDAEEVEAEGSEEELNNPDEPKEQPLNKDKRFQELIAAKNKAREENVQMRQQMEQMNKILENLSNKETKTEEIPEPFLKAFGQGDPERDQKGWQAFKGILDFQKEQILQEIEQKQADKEAQVSEWESWVDTQVSTFKELGKDISKEEFVSIIQEFEPAKGLKEYDPQKVVKIHELRKELAELKLKTEKNKGQEKKKQLQKLSGNIAPSRGSSSEKTEWTLDDFQTTRNLYGKTK